MPLARNADSSSLAVPSASTPGRRANRWIVGSTRSPNAAAERACDVQIPAISARRAVGEDADHGQAQLPAGLRVAHVDRDGANVLSSR